MSVTITTLMENTISDHKSLLCEHGLSFHIQMPDCSFLFDCGAGGNLLHNAAKLNIPLDNLDFVVGSHAHYDHGGGFRPLVDRGAVKRLLTGEGYFNPKYSLSGIRHTFLGIDFDRDFLRANGIEHQVCGDLLEIADGCWLVGNFENTSEWESIPERFMIRKDGAFVPDRFAEEVALALRMEDGLALLVGCSHPGIINIARTVQKRLALPIRGVWGGTHLVEAGPERIAATLAELKKVGVRYMGLSHCSGDPALECIKSDPDLAGCRLRAGDGVILD